MCSAGHTEHFEITVVIPNWNGLRYLPECLSSLQNQTFKEFEVIVVDNGSTDGSVDFIKTKFPLVRLIELPENTGFAAACNLGIKTSRGRYIAILNNDTEAMPQWLERLFTAAERDERIGMVASKILLNPETREIDSVGMLLYPDGIGRQRGRGEIDNGQFDREEKILYPSACAALYRMEMFHEIGLFDEDFFAYCEDTDIGLRGRLAGWKAVFAPDAIVFHKYSETSGKYSVFKAIHIERNRIWVGVKNFPVAWVFKMPYYTLARYAVQLYSVYSLKGSTARFREAQSMKDIVSALVKAYVSAFKGLPLMLKKRRNMIKNMPRRKIISLLKQYRISAAELVLRD